MNDWTDDWKDEWIWFRIGKKLKFKFFEGHENRENSGYAVWSKGVVYDLSDRFGWFYSCDHTIVRQVAWRWNDCWAGVWKVYCTWS